MQTTELIGILRQEYTPERGYGVVRVKEAEWENIPFVVPPPPPTTIDFSSLPHQLLGQANKVLNALPTYRDSDELDKLINYLFVRREVVQSSRLEGTWSTIDHVLTPGELTGKNQGRDEHIAVRSYAHALEKIIEQAASEKEKIYSIDLVKQIHQKIVEHDPKSNGVAGKLRTKGEPGALVTIGGLGRKENSIYNPAPPEYIMNSLTKVIEWYGNSEMAQLGDAGAGLTLPVRLAIGHAHFEAVHPFTDGNGRTGRSLWPLQMVCSGSMPLYLSGYVEEKKSDYSQSLESAQKKLDYTPLITFICNAIIESDYELKKSRQAIIQLKKTWAERANFRSGSTALRSLDILLHKPILSSETLQQELGVSGPASTEAIKQLVEKKIIRHRGNENRKRIYAAEELIHLLSRPFASDIDLALEKAKKLME